MTYSVYQHWDPLKVCVVGKSYPPELYDYIQNEKVRKVFYKIAEETEEDYQQLITLLTKLNVEVLRVDVDPAIENAKHAIKNNNPIMKPWFMQPRDHSIMLGSTFYYPKDISHEHIINHVRNQGNEVRRRHDITMGRMSILNSSSPEFDYAVNGAMTTRIGKDLYIGTGPGRFSFTRFPNVQDIFKEKLSDYRVQIVDTQGHTDGTFCPVVPGLIICLNDPIDYTTTFPGWEIVYLQNESWSKMYDFLQLKKINSGKWWVPGEELNADFTNYVETWMNHWVGYAEESVFDVNMLVVDKKNVIVNGYNKIVFDAFSRYGITPHICNFRHRYFWDGGLHCITSDLHREGVMEDYFPERN